MTAPAPRQNPLRLSFCGRFVVTDDLHPVLYTIAEARDWQRRVERQAAAYERDADLSDRKDMPAEAEISRGMAVTLLNLAADLAEVLAGAQQKVAA
jgi:hypothetical protein